MSEVGKDPAIKLFGRTIAVPEEDGLDHGTAEEAGEDRKENRGVVNDEANPANDAPKELDHCDKDATSGTSNGHIEDHQPGTLDDMATSNPKSEQNHIETNGSGKEKVIKKPDKILPCPRCKSLDTKFCYYNNYNVNQPRHFCKNCQRYWTAGGTMRNVPVGAGRRKNKHSALHYRQLTMPSDGMPSPCTDIPDPNHGQILPSELPMPSKSLKGNGTILKFGTEAPLCESLVNAFHLGDHKRDEMVATMACGEPSCSSVKESDCVENELPEKMEQVVQNGSTGSCNGLTPSNPLQYYPAPPWAYPWSPMWNNGTPMAAGHCMPGLVYAQESNSPNPIPWNPTPLIAAPFCRPTIPVPFVPASFWGCMSTWASSTWSVPWVGSNVLPPLSCMSNRIGSGNNSPKSGKHSRDVNTQVEEKTERSLWVPKTLRIDDPDEAAKSSIWATLGIKPDRCETGAKGGIFKAFEPKIEHKGHQSDATPVWHANPAALSRSQTFQEST